MYGSASTLRRSPRANNLAERPWGAAEMIASRLARLLNLARALEANPRSRVGDLAQTLGACRRTIYRDIAFLSDSGFSYTRDSEAGGHSAEDATVRLPVTLSIDEALAVSLIARYMRHSHVIPDESVAMSAALKLDNLIPPAVHDSCAELLKHMEVHPESSSDARAIRDAMSQLQAALMRRNKITGTYDCCRHDTPLDLVLHPYRLVHINRGWHLVAFTEHLCRIRTYRVERFTRLRIIKEKYRMYGGFKLENYLRGAWVLKPGEKRHHVVVLFDRQRAEEVEEIQWHKTQRIVYNDDGSMLFEVDVDGLEEISWWIMGYGDHAEVLEPPELRDIIAGRANRMRAAYADAAPRGDPPEAPAAAAG